MELYFIAILPGVELRNRIKSLKEELQQKYNVKHALKLPAHITLQIPFKLPEEEEESLVSSLDNLSRQQAAFPVDLSGFGSFPPRVIYIKVENPGSLRLLHERLRILVKDFIKNEKQKKEKYFHPHITIATRDLDKETFRRAWVEFQKRHFEASFDADTFVLFRHNGKSWNLHREFFLKKQSR